MTASAREQVVREAIERLLAQIPERAPTANLTDRNLILEAGVAKASFYRCVGAVAHWRKVKEVEVRRTLDQFEAGVADGTISAPAESDLLGASRVDGAALRQMPEELQERWRRILRPQRLSQTDVSKDEIINSLIAKLYATTLAVRKRDQTIARQAALIEQLGGNVRPLRKKPSA